MRTFEDFDRHLDAMPHLDRRKLTHNTYLYRRPDDTLAIRLHNTDIIIVRQDNTFMLDSGGWRTVTTKDRMNRFCPARVYQERHQWYIWPGPTPFFDGIVVDLSGKPINVDEGQPEAALAEQAKLDKMINRMIKRLSKMSELPHPSNGDCWGCAMVAKDRSRPMGSDCVWSHLGECYIHGSLIYRAMEWAGYRPEGIAIHWRGWQSENRSWSKQTIIRTMRRFLRHEGQRIMRMRQEVENAV